MKIWTVDAFTDKPFAGNPAAVTIVDEFPLDEMCQKIAAVHSEPPLKEERLFMSVLPGSKAQIKEWESKQEI